MARNGRRSHRGRWALLGFLVLLAAIAVLVVVADGIARHKVERRLADRIQSSQHLSARPTVTIHGFSFLTQVLAGKYDHVSIVARSPVVEQNVQLNRVDVELHGVKVKTTDALNGQVRSLPVKSGTGTGFIGYSAISAALNKYTSSLGLTLTIKGTTPGRATVSALGLSIGVSAKVTDGKLTIVADPADVAALPALVQPVVTQALNTPVPLPPFPFGVSLSSAQLEPTGVNLQAVSHNSVFPI